MLRRHDSLLAGRMMSTTNHIGHVENEEEEEEAEQLFRRYAYYMCILSCLLGGTSEFFYLWEQILSEVILSLP